MIGTEKFMLHFWTRNVLGATRRARPIRSAQPKTKERNLRCRRGCRSDQSAKLLQRSSSRAEASSRVALHVCPERVQLRQLLVQGFLLLGEGRSLLVAGGGLVPRFLGGVFALGSRIRHGCTVRLLRFRVTLAAL